MEFVGRAVTVVRRDLDGAVCSGTVRSYDASSGLFDVVFDGGDSEELDLSEVSAGAGFCAGHDGGGGIRAAELGRKPKKRRLLGEPGNGNVDMNFPVDCVVLDEVVGNGGLNEGNERNLEIRGNGDLKIGDGETLEMDRGGSGAGDSRDGFDLNAGFNLNLTENSELVSEERVLAKREHIDLNLDANGDFDDAPNSPVEVKTREWKFDLNLEVAEEVKEDLDDHNVEELKVVDCVEGCEKNEDVEDLHSNGNLKSVELIYMDSVEQLKNEDVKPRASIVVLGTTSFLDSDLAEVPVKFPAEDGERDNSGSPFGQRSSRRKRRKVLDIEETLPRTVLRRSARRGTPRNLLSEDLCEVNDTLSSPEEKPSTSASREPEKPVFILPPKLELPPSSQNLDLNDIPILDLFSVYACLQTFSTLLFLSPFELEDFVAALKSKSPSSLIDCVHVAILQTLRKHLEFLSSEGSEPGSDCLRCLNWDFLDAITWPIFMVEYFLIFDSELKPRFDLTSLKLFKSDYCQQPASVKIEILRCLCDDLIEVEAVRSEMNRRSLAAESDMVFERNLKHHGNKKRRTSIGISSRSRLEDDVAVDSLDRNFDECCLCKMDGSLICCDGCPAAYHSKCVGIASDHLPEGDWFCPECAIYRDNPCMKMKKSSLRGAELLGTDPHGRLYFHSSGYLLVSDSYETETESSFSYYHKDDLNMVIEVLKSSDFVYGDILVAICKHWDSISLDETVKSIDSLYPMSSNTILKGHRVVSSPLVPLISAEIIDGDFGLGSDATKSVNLSDTMGTTGNSLVTSEESAETPQTQTSSGIHRDTRVSGNSQGGSGYVNYYSFGRIASSIAEDLLDKSKEKIKEVTVGTEEEITSRQMKIIVKKCPKFCWSNIQNPDVNVQKEKCGWCFSCRSSIDDLECLFFMNVKEFSHSDVLSIQTKEKKSHLTDVLCQIISIEHRLRGLLHGPWLSPNYSKLWCKNAVKAVDMASVKLLLLTLESNICPLALSAEWSKHVDSDVSVGSASHIITSSARGSAKNMIGRRRPKGSENELGPTLNKSSGLGIFWWRGGKLSRKVFNWKVLPHSLVSKAARQAGCTKIPGVLYPENSEYSKRSKNVAWKAAVETSSSPEQLAFQLRDLDSNIKWDDIENTHPLPLLDKEAKKSTRLFKKVIVRRKSMQGGLAKYLLDFGGKRRAIPDVVRKNGSVIEESSSDKKKYWLEESFVPLHLLKNFEEKRVARKSNDAKSEKLVEQGRVRKRRDHQKKGFDYLFAKAERSVNYQCGHCCKDVLIREAVSCQHCKEFFHKRHVRKSGGAVATKCKYTCYSCHSGTRVRIVTKKGKSVKLVGKLKPQNSKIIQTDLKSTRLRSSKNVSTRGRKVTLKNNKKALPVVPLRRSARKAKCLVIQKKKQRGRKKAKPVKSTKEIKEKPKKIPSCKGKRTKVLHSYWLKGLRFSRKLNDERVLFFKSKSCLSSTEPSSSLNQSKCQLCDEAEHTNTLDYIACEICKEWFHTDAIGVSSENIDNIIGFRCHNCCERDPPICPHSMIANFKSDVAQKIEIQNDDDNADECIEELSNAVTPLPEDKEDLKCDWNVTKVRVSEQNARKETFDFGEQSQT